MAYEALYRRYRPSRFQDAFFGQDHVVAALRNAIEGDRVGHAYLFSGPRGTGKTTSARILAKALNCTDLQGGEP
ncbi:MAG: AAA family ATPase, partial [Acidimicrobiales bacterium]|nr:AAA family ATPase [Acidimicrobiales bacterium]